jgi:putative two-component system response regulator
VDDISENIARMAEVLGEGYRVIFALNGPDALAAALAEPRPSLVLLDVLMPGMDGHEVCRRLKADFRTRSIPVIFLTSQDDAANEEQGFRLGAVDYLHKPSPPAIVRQRVRIHLDLHNQTAALEKRVRERTLELERTRMEILQRLARASQYREYEAGSNVLRMCRYCQRLGLAAGLSPVDADMLLLAASLHDIGMMGVPDDILMKTGRLTSAENAVMQSHTIIGSEIIGKDRSELLSLARSIALTHHERWDGGGYPKGLIGNAIPLAGRIVAICDTFDSLTSGKGSKRVWKPEDACDYVTSEAGKAFDPALVALFKECLLDILKIREQYSERIP